MYVQVHESQLKGDQMLKVFSYTAKALKLLSSGSHGNFTTDPSKATLYLPDLLRLFLTSLPLKARLYHNVGNEYPLPDLLGKEVITLEGVSTETSLIASAVR